MNSIGGNDIEVGFTIVTIIDRFWQYYLINMIVPSFMLVIISFITFIIPASGVDSRIALNMTLFLSLTALQFVINDQLPKSRCASRDDATDRANAPLLRD